MEGPGPASASAPGRGLEEGEGEGAGIQFLWYSLRMDPEVQQSPEFEALERCVMGGMFSLGEGMWACVRSLPSMGCSLMQARGY